MIKKEFSHSAPKTEGPHVPDVTHIRNPDVLHEVSDVNTTPIYKFGFWMVVIVIGTGILMWFFYQLLAKREAAQDPPRPVLQKEKANELPPEPRLQLAPGHEVHPLDEMAEMKVQQKAMLSSYGWVDRSNGTVRIPIDEAKKLLLAKGLPVGAQATTDSTGVKPNAAANVGTTGDEWKYGRAVPSGQSGGHSTEWHR